MSALLNKPQGWQARLQLEYEKRGASTVLARRQHHGPLLVQRPFYPEGGVCHSYIIHPPGGVVGGDHLQIDVQLNAQAHALLTTPASGKFYSSQHKQADMHQSFRVAEAACLEWLPQDNIFFEGSHTRLTTEVELAADARFIGWEISCLGRPLSHAAFTSGNCDQSLHIRREGLPVLIDKLRLQAGHDVLTSSWGLSGHSVSATLIATPVEKPLLNTLREYFQMNDGFVFSATLMDDVLVCRFLGQQGEQARRVLEQAWHLIRPHVIGVDACSPRIWKT